jgi:hypothetical protein
MTLSATLIRRQNGVEISVTSDDLGEVAEAYRALEAEFGNEPGYNANNEEDKKLRQHYAIKKRKAAEAEAKKLTREEIKARLLAAQEDND